MRHDKKVKQIKNAEIPVEILEETLSSLVNAPTITDLTKKVLRIVFAELKNK